MTRTTRWVDRWSILASAPFPWRICHREIVLTEVARECIDLHGRHHKSPLPAPRYCSRPRLAKSVLAVSSPASLPLSESGHFVCEFNRAHRVLPTDLTSFLDPFPCRVGIAVLASRSKEERTRDFSIFLRPAYRDPGRAALSFKQPSSSPGAGPRLLFCRRTIAR